MNDVAVRLAAPSEYAALAERYLAWGYAGGLAPAEAVFVAHRGATPVGIVRRTREQGVLMLRGMQVAPDAQRQGIGRQLLAAFEDALDDREPCWCIPFAHLTRFYGMIGFEECDEAEAPRFLQERLVDYRARGHVVCVMVRRARVPSA